MVNTFAAELGKVAAQKHADWGVGSWLNQLGTGAKALAGAPSDLAAQLWTGGKGMEMPKPGGPGINIHPPLTKQELAAGRAKYPPRPMPPSPAIRPRPLLASKPTPAPALSGATKATLPGAKPFGQ